MQWIFYVRLPVLFMIRIYQRTLSLDHGPLRQMFPEGYCRYHPTCSEYGYRCIARHGLIKGGYYTIHRIVRCNPFSPGGEDHAPE